MDYRIELIDSAGRRVGSFNEVPLLEAVRTSPDRPDRIRGILPDGVSAMGPGWRVRVWISGALFCEADVTAVKPRWSDTRKLILDQYVSFQHVVEFDAQRLPDALNTGIAVVYTNWTIADMVKDAVNRARGPLHYYVAHTAYPDGAARELQKFLARKTPANELGIGTIATGQWIGGDRMNLDGAYAKDGDTIAGLVVDGQSWPDLRMMMIDSEETSKNSHAIKRHPEVADWTAAQYNASGYRIRADQARDALQALIDTKGIDFIELNPHRNAAGEFDDRVDAFGRYVGLVYGGGECFNAAMVEQGRADVYLYEDGRYHVPEMALKEYFSYTGEHEDSIEAAPVVLGNYDATGDVLEALAAWAYAAGGYVWSIDVHGGVAFRKAERADRILMFDALRMGVAFGFDSADMANVIYFEGNPVTSTLSKTYARSESIDEYRFQSAALDHFGVWIEDDADKLVDALLDDVAYPALAAEVEFFHGANDIAVGDLIELRGEPLARFTKELPGEWAARYAGKLIGRVSEVVHRFTGEQVSTTVTITSPLRTVRDPITFMVRSRPDRSELFQFRLDAAAVGLDVGYHLD